MIMKNISSKTEQREDFFCLLATFFCVIISIIPFTSASAHNIADTVGNEKKTIYYQPLPHHGSFLVRTDSDRIISKKVIRPMTQFSIFDVLSTTYFLTPLSLGGFASNNSVSLYGSHRNDIGMRYNTRSLTNPIHGAVNLAQFPLETVENIEVMTGTQAIVLGDNSSGILLNMQEGMHNSASPFTRLRYAQSSYNFVASEGEFSQNFAPNWNIDAGFRRHVGEGRFTNSWVDLWNVYGKIRWTQSRSQWTLSHIFTNYGNGLHGGLSDSTTTFSDPINAQIRFTDMFERILSHDITLSYSSINTDSTILHSATSYFSYGTWALEKGIQYNLSAFDSSRISAPIMRTFGIMYIGSIKFSPQVVLKFGGETEQQIINASIYNQNYSGISSSLFSLTNIDVSARLHIQPGIRLRFSNNQLTVNLGTKTEYYIFDNLLTGIDISLSTRRPTLIEGLNLTSEKHILGIGYIQWRDSHYSIKCDVFSRSVNDLILHESLMRNNVIVGTTARNDGIRNTVGASINGYYSLNNAIRLLSGFLWQHSSTNGVFDDRLPSFQGIVGAEYTRVFGRSTVKGGISFRIFSKNYGELFIPQTHGTVLYPEKNTGVITNGGQAFIGAQLGNAYVQFALYNILNAEYWSTPLYTELDRHLRISVNWSFFD